MQTVFSTDHRPAIELLEVVRSRGTDLARCQFIARCPSGDELIVVEHGNIAGCYQLSGSSQCLS